MIDVALFLKSLAMGAAVAAPMGPMGVIVVRRTLARGYLAGLGSGLGIATADGCYGAVAAFGLTAISAALIEHQFWLRLIGGAFLVWLGLRIFFSETRARGAMAGERGPGGGFLTMLGLTLTNPMTILSFGAIFASLGLVAPGGDHVAAATMTAGVFLGSLAWWMVLAGAVTLLRRRVTDRVMTWLNRVAGALIAAFGIAALIGARHHTGP
jgi:threonine/homoserine/homoserine lactone efflux protein